MNANRYRQGTLNRALAKGTFPTGYLGVFGRYSKRYPKGADRSALIPPDSDYSSAIANKDFVATVDELWRLHLIELAARSSQPSETGRQSGA